MTERAIIVDLDGTLSDHTHRVGYAKSKNWDKYFEKMVDDPINPWVENVLVTNFEMSFKTLIVTGRPEKYYKETVEWLKKNQVEYEHIYMRHGGDYRPDSEIIKDIYKTISKDYEVCLVLDDRKSIIEMYRSFGLQAWQVGDGDF